MRNLIKIKKSILIPSLFIAGTLFLVSSCSENKTANSKEVSQLEDTAKLATDDQTILVVDNNNDNDTTFLIEIAEMQLEEISLGKLAQQKGTSAHVKALGKMMESDHTKTLNELKGLAQSKSIPIPNSPTENSKDTYTKLGDKTGNDFGKAYSDMMVEHHEDAIELFEKLSTEAKDAEIRGWASKKLPGLRTHLKHAEECKKECDKMKS